MLAADERFEQGRAGRPGIEAGQIGEVPSACVGELRLAADRQFLERLEAVGGEAGGEDGDAFPGATERVEPRGGGGLEPFRASEARLEGDLDRAVERFGEQTRGRLALVVRSGEQTSETQSLNRI